MNIVNKQSIIYQGENGEIILKGDESLDTIWAGQSQIAEIFGIDRTVVTKHIGNIFKDKELDASMVCADFAHTTKHGAIEGKEQTRKIKFYNLDIILSVGYRTNSSKAISFRKWANSILKEYITEGVAVNSSILQENTQKFQEALTYMNSLNKNTLSKLDSCIITFTINLGKKIILL